jgi:nicotinate-nucleotide pyrophosphorylase (carboxylating)
MRDFPQLTWDALAEEDCRQLVRLAVREDLDRSFDWTTAALVAHDALGAADIVAREPGVLAGLAVVQVVIDEMAPAIDWRAALDDGDSLSAGGVVGTISGPARDLLTCERIVLNFLGRLSGIATLTRQYVDAVAGSSTQIYDTRKTTPGWRRLEKYAVACGGGRNHRAGLYAAVLIKDNHLALGAAPGAEPFSPAKAVERARNFVSQMQPDAKESMLIEVEVDRLDQLDEVLPAAPDIVLLDNMTQEQLRQAVSRRDALGSKASLEASGGVCLSTVAEIAATGVDRISVGALTHGAQSLDLGLDWRTSD